MALGIKGAGQLPLGGSEALRTVPMCLARLLVAFLPGLSLNAVDLMTCGLALWGFLVIDEPPGGDSLRVENTTRPGAVAHAWNASSAGG